MTPNIEKIILKNISSSEIVAATKEDGMIALQEDGVLKALQGITSLEEVRRVTGEIFNSKL